MKETQNEVAASEVGGKAKRKWGKEGTCECKKDEQTDKRRG